MKDGGGMESALKAQRKDSPDQRPKRFSGLRVSMERMPACSRRTMGWSEWKGMMAAGGVP
jgi:hypothetical protein